MSFNYSSLLSLSQAGSLGSIGSPATTLSKSNKPTSEKFNAPKYVAWSVAEKATSNKKIALYTPEYYAACTLGGILACGTTHALVTPLDLVKCRRQVDKSIYKGNFDGWRKIWATEGGIRGIYTGFGPTLIGYSFQGAAKYGFYEYFKKFYSDLAGPANAHQYRSLIYLAGSASAEFFADIALCPWEALKVCIPATK